LAAIKRKNGKIQVAYILSKEVVDLVKAEAFQTDRWEAHVVEERLRDSFARDRGTTMKPSRAPAFSPA
jgi:hypothetical protein